MLQNSTGCLFVECFVEYANTKLATKAYASTPSLFLGNCAGLFTVHAHHFSTPFKWKNVLFKALFVKEKTNALPLWAQHPDTGVFWIFP